MRAIVRTSAAALALALGAGHTPAGAQNYEGGAVVKFGVFWQATHTSIDEVLPAAGHGTQGGWLHGGVSAGIDFRLPYRWLIGGEIDGSFGDGRGFVNGTDYGFDYLFNLRGRLGYQLRPDLMVYAASGISYLGFEAQRQGVGRFKASETVNGYILGLGAEYEWHHVILFGEYNHGWYEPRQFSLGTVRHQAEADTDVFRLGIKFKVGHDHHHWIGRHYDPPPLK